MVAPDGVGVLSVARGVVRSLSGLCGVLVALMVSGVCRGVLPILSGCCSSWWWLLFVVVVSGGGSDGVAVAVVVVVAVPIVAGCRGVGVVGVVVAVSGAQSEGKRRNLLTINGIAYLQGRSPPGGCRCGQSAWRGVFLDLQRN